MIDDQEHAARGEQGLELTELERSILAPLQEVLGEEEVRAVGAGVASSPRTSSSSWPTWDWSGWC
ncbi:hypothetical protein ACH4VT_36890 [Streptomyces lydicus]|uniref:hypothetical protein n=1 Tax=Streptomyces lydicus TaxID=47763 RepID=UPI00379DDC18